MSVKPAIVVVAYRRLHTLERLLNSINKAIYNLDDITLIISIDFHCDNADVVNCAEQFKWAHGPKIVKTHRENLGLRRHIIECGDYSLEYGTVIILEDDEYVAPSFYEYTRLAHDYYDEDDRIAGISLYAHEWNGYAGKRFQPISQGYDAYFGQFSCTWGESWSAKQWTCFKEWYSDNTSIVEDELLPSAIYKWNKSWGKYFIRYIVESKKYYVMPYRPVCTVFGETGTHAKRVELEVQVALDWGNSSWNFCMFEEGTHYDAFFENVDIKEMLAEKYCISKEGICIDLYGLKGRDFHNSRYVLTTRKMDAHIIDEFDLNMRPHDINVLLGMQGKGIFLYDLSLHEKNAHYDSMNRLEYDLAGVHGLESIVYGFRHCWKVLKSQLGRR